MLVRKDKRVYSKYTGHLDVEVITIVCTHINLMLVKVQFLNFS